MARYAVCHTCGHAEEHDVTGSRATRENQVARLRSSPCSRCYHQTLTDAAVDEADVRGWPSLRGSHDDVAWALVLRSKRVRELEERSREEYIAARLQALGRPPTEDEQQRIATQANDAVPRMLASAGKHLLARTEAEWWIKTRRQPLLDVLGEDTSSVDARDEAEVVEAW